MFIVDVPDGTGQTEFAVDSPVVANETASFGDSLAFFFDIRFMVVAQIVGVESFGEYAARVTNVGNKELGLGYQGDAGGAPNLLRDFPQYFLARIASTKLGIALLALCLLDFIGNGSHFVLAFETLQLLVQRDADIGQRLLVITLYKALLTFQSPNVLTLTEGCNLSATVAIEDAEDADASFVVQVNQVGILLRSAPPLHADSRVAQVEFFIIPRLRVFGRFWLT